MSHETWTPRPLTAISTVGETVKAFIPAHLPPVPPVNFSGQLQVRLDAALVWLGRLDAVCILLPDPDLFLYICVRKEAVLSSMIEGTQCSLSDLLLFAIQEPPACRWMTRAKSVITWRLWSMGWSG
jgi:hypothetical protein